MEKKLDNNYTRMLRAILNKSWQQNPTRHQLYGHLPPITKTTQARWTRHTGHCWRSRDELISDVALWTPTYGRAKAGRPAWTYIQQLCEDTGCSPEDLPEAMNNRKKWRERVRDIHTSGMMIMMIIELERRIRGDLIETFKIIRKISNSGRHFFNISPQTGNLLSRQISKTTKLLDFLLIELYILGENYQIRSKTKMA